MRECSGVNQLLAVVAMALPAGLHLALESGVACSSIGFASSSGAYLSNGVRIALVGFPRDSRAEQRRSPRSCIFSKASSSRR